MLTTSMFESSRRAFLKESLRLSGASLLIGNARLRAQAPVTGEPVVSGIDQPGLVSFDKLMTTFIQEQQVPGAALAVTKDSRLVYARGFGWADRETRQPVEPTALFRIASISKPITAVAVLQLVERKLLDLDTSVWELLHLAEPDDPRWKKVTVLHLLQHTGGWDRGISFDPMFRSLRIAQTLDVLQPVEPTDIIRYMLRQPLDFDPGSRYAYSNFGYCLLGRIVERVTTAAYEEHVRREVLLPLGIRRMRLGKTLVTQRADNEVRYYDERDRTGLAVIGAIGEQVPTPYGAWSLEAMDAHGGWIGSAVDLVRFASAFDDPQACEILQPKSIDTMLVPPEGSAGHQPDGGVKDVYYGCGWQVRRLSGREKRNIWHTGALAGTSSLLVRRHDGINWAVLFNSGNGPSGKSHAAQIDGLIHRAADQVRDWPPINQFSRFE